MASSDGEFDPVPPVEGAESLSTASTSTTGDTAAGVAAPSAVAAPATMEPAVMGIPGAPPPTFRSSTSARTQPPPGVVPEPSSGRWLPPPGPAPSRSTALVKHLLAAAAKETGLLALLRSSRRLPGRARVRVYGYHRVVDDARAAARATMPPLSISTKAFGLHLDHLACHYAVWPLERAFRVLAGEAEAPDRDIAVITFDDGYRDVRTHAAPLLKSRGLPATLFVATQDVGGHTLLHDRIYALVRRAACARMPLLGLPAPESARWALARADAALAAGAAMPAADAILFGLPGGLVLELARQLAERVGEPVGPEAPPTLTWAEIADLRCFGFSIGAHTATHAHLPLEDDAGLVRELLAPREEIARWLGEAPAALAYPAGRFDARVIAAAQRAGYRFAVTTENRPNPSGTDLMRIGRKVLSEAHSVGADGLVSPALVAAHLDGLFDPFTWHGSPGGEVVLEEPWIR